MTEDPLQVDIRYDAGPTGCGELIMNLYQTMKLMSTEQTIEVVSYDQGAKEDIPAWCRLQGHLLLKYEDRGKARHYFIQKQHEKHD